ncbi:MAG: C-type lectin domain-containing protein [Sandaracinaceae bacterium]
MQHCGVLRFLPLLLLVPLTASGCLLDRTGIVPEDGGRAGADAGFDAGRVDAGRVDGGRNDAGRDAGALDAGADGGGALDACVPAPELCNGVDDDCDPTTEDGAADPELGAACDGDDTDTCEDDQWVCAGGELRCEGLGGDATEAACDGTDDDCDGRIDEGTTECGGCDRRERDGRSYLFCRDLAVRADWFAAAAACQALGYELAIIEDEPENTWISTTAAALDGVEAWWIGLSDHATENTFVWDGTGAVAAFTNWNDGDNPQPNDDIRPAEEDWVYLESNEKGSWFDNFQRSSRFICEPLR